MLDIQEIEAAILNLGDQTEKHRNVGGGRGTGFELSTAS